MTTRYFFWLTLTSMAGALLIILAMSSSADEVRQRSICIQKYLPEICVQIFKRQR